MNVTTCATEVTIGDTTYHNKLDHHVDHKPSLKYSVVIRGSSVEKAVAKEYNDSLSDGQWLSLFSDKKYLP